MDNFIFFGSSRLSVIVLDELERLMIIPSAIVTTPDRPKGRKLILTPTEVKIFGIEHGIPVFQFEKLDADAVAKLRTAMPVKYFLVASYGLIIPQAILDLPQYGVLNIHPSLLPEYRGATPIQQAILDDRSDTGVTIMQVDAKMDHGPILVQEKRNAGELWPKKYADLEEELARHGARMIAHTIGDILNKKIQPQEQNHELATFTKKIEKSDGEIDINDTALRGPTGRSQFLKFNAYYEWPTTFFFAKEKRIKITDAIWDNVTQEMKIIKVIPEGQKETLWSEYKKKLL
jgi:methionyl-tRNA formyltransferase